MRARAPLALSCLASAALAGCGSRTASELPPPVIAPGDHAVATRATAVPGSPLVATVDGRARTLAITDARTGARLAAAPAGVGPTHVACAGPRRCYVTDTRGEGLLVFLVAGGGRRLTLQRRVYLPGGPYALAVDPARRRLWVTLPARDQLALLPAHGRPHVLARFATIRRPDAVAVDTRTGAALVTAPGSGGRQRVLP